VEEIGIDTDPSEIIVLDEPVDEWRLAIARVEREEREWSEALRRARLGSETPPDLGISADWDEDDEWAWRIAIARASLASDPTDVGPPAPFDDERTLEFEVPAELLTLGDYDEQTREVVIPAELLQKLTR
jgi:hypothetical protein